MWWSPCCGGISASDLHNTHEREKSKMAVRLGLFPHTRIVQVICGRFISAERLNATGGGRIEGAYRASLKYSVVSSLLPGAPRLRSSCWLNIFRFSVFCAVGGRRNTGKNQGPAGRRRICHLRYGRAGEVLMYSVHTLSLSLFSTPALKKLPMPTHEDLFRGYQDKLGIHLMYMPANSVRSWCTANPQDMKEGDSLQQQSMIGHFQSCTS